MHGGPQIWVNDTCVYVINRQCWCSFNQSTVTGNQYRARHMHKEATMHPAKKRVLYHCGVKKIIQKNKIKLWANSEVLKSGKCCEQYIASSLLTQGDQNTSRSIPFCQIIKNCIQPMSAQYEGKGKKKKRKSSSNL